MYNLPNFCRVCLKYDRNLIDLEHIENEPNETLMTKLQQCVSEVEWKLYKPLLCHPCIKRLNLAYTFKKQCIESATMLKSYLAYLNRNKDETKTVDANNSNAFMMLPNQKCIKIVVGPQNQTTFQNVFLNVMPTPPLQLLSPNNSKDTNQNVFLNLNNTFQKFVPVQESSVNQLLTESKSEELSVEIDPMVFGLGDECAEDDEVNDWEDVISAVKINSRSNGASPQSKTQKSTPHYVPILPKTTDDKMDFSKSGEHFLSSQLFPPTEYTCETCEKPFSTKITLKYHIKNFHMGKFPFKCDFCSNEFILRSEYEACMRYHKGDYDPLTLNDFKINDSIESISEQDSKEATDLVCDICHREFNSPSGLLRHKVRKHNQKSKKKYFIKGMKNARCDICNRDFSTQSYMQLHRKLHLRDDIGYKYKVFGKNRYAKSDEKKEETADNQISNKIEESNSKEDEEMAEASKEDEETREEMEEAREEDEDARDEEEDAREEEEDAREDEEDVREDEEDAREEEEDAREEEEEEMNDSDSSEK